MLRCLMQLIMHCVLLLVWKVIMERLMIVVMLLQQG
jgi:hypothetical protein